MCARVRLSQFLMQGGAGGAHKREDLKETPPSMLTKSEVENGGGGGDVEGGKKTGVGSEMADDGLIRPDRQTVIAAR